MSGTVDHRNILPVQLDNTKAKSTCMSLTHCALINCRSIIYKSADFQVELVHNKVDICSLTETWIREDDTTTVSQISPPGYKAISVPRSNKQGEGIAVVYKDSIKIRRSNTYDYSSMECTDFVVSLPGLSLNMAVIYRPPNKSVLSFTNDFLDYIERNINSPGKLLLTGDFNIHVNNLESPDTNTFLYVLDSLGLHNHIGFPTHHLNNTLDLVIMSVQDKFIESSRPGRLFSDHNMVYFNLTTSKQFNKAKEITYRKLKNINIANFSKDVESHLTSIHTDSMPLAGKIRLYRGTLEEILDKHAPLRTKRVPDRVKIPWFSDEVAAAICDRKES